jgi:VanZ family protein
LTDLQPHIHPVYLQPRVVLTWVVTAAWAGTMSVLSTGAYSVSVTGWLLAQLLLLLHIHLIPHTFATLHFLIRKLAHGSEYAIFGLLLYHSFEPRRPEGWNARSAFGALVVAGLYSLLDEYHQSFVPGRTASLVDCGIDTLGALVGLLLLYVGTRLQGREPAN